MNALKYRDRELTSDATLLPSLVTLTITDLRDHLLRGEHAQVKLEPGDATRYDLVLTPIVSGPSQRGLLVTRMKSGSPVESDAIWDWDDGASEFALQCAGIELGAGDTWSTTLLTWWITILCRGEALHA